MAGVRPIYRQLMYTQRMKVRNSSIYVLFDLIDYRKSLKACLQDSH